MTSEQHTSLQMRVRRHTSLLLCVNFINVCKKSQHTCHHLFTHLTFQTFMTISFAEQKDIFLVTTKTLIPIGFVSIQLCYAEERASYRFEMTKG